MQIQGFKLAAGGVLLALAASSCTDYGFAQQELGLHHDAEADRVGLVVVSRGLYHTTAESAQTIAEDAAGARHVILVGFPFEFALDELEADLQEDVERGEEDPLVARALDFVRGIEVLGAGAWAGEDGEPALYQRISIPHAAEGMALFSAWLNRLCLEEQDPGADIEKSWGARSAELFREHVRAGRSWAALEEGKLVLRLPVSPEGAARWLEDVLDGADTDGVTLGLVQALSALSVEDGVATLTFAPDEDGWIRLRTKWPDQDADASMPWTPAQGATLPDAPPPEIARFLKGGKPARKGGR